MFVASKCAGMAVLALAAGLFAVPALADDGYRGIHTFFFGASGGGNPNGVVAHQTGTDPTTWALFGTTGQGGGGDPALCNDYGGCGIAYKLVPPPADGLHWSLLRLYVFQGGEDGVVPNGPLIFDAAGDAYGTTEQGGAGCGTVFKLTPSPPGYFWHKQTLATFACGGADSYPGGRLAFDGAGNLYGTASGIVFRLTPMPHGLWARTTLYQLAPADGSGFGSSVVFDPEGNLYGTTGFGGVGGGQGTIYRLSPPKSAGGAWSHDVLYRFPSTGLSGDRSSLLREPDGTFYGAANDSANGYGGVFRISPPRPGQTAWRYEQLYEFSGPDGENPSPLAHLDGTQALYGVTVQGGRPFDPTNPLDGVVFKLSPPASGAGAWTETVLHGFPTAQNIWYGVVPGALIRAPDGDVYGAKYSGGGSPQGILFKLSP